MLHSIRQFIEALQDPYGLTRTLGEIEVCRSSDGEPLRWVGNSAVVFKIRCGGRYKMLKCYTRPMEHLEAIYQEKLLRQELYVWQADGQGEWCDVVIDDWIEGITLYEAVMRARNSGRPGRTLRPGRTVGFQNRRTGIDPTHIRRRFRLHRRLGRRPHGTLLAFHRPHRCRSDRLFGLQCGKTVRKRPGDRRPRRTTSGHRPQGTPNHLAYLTANNYLYPKNTCSDRVVSRQSEK